MGAWPPVKIALVYTASNVVCVLLWPVLSAAPARILAICMVALPLFSLLAYAVSWRTVSENHWPSPATSHPRAIRKLAVWVAAFSLAYGICAHALTPAPSPSIAYAARLLPNLLVVGGLLWASGRFDLDVIYRLSVPVLTAGCLLTAIPGMAHSAAYFTLEMGDELFSILFFVVACGASYRLHTSAAFLCGIVFFERISLELMAKPLYEVLASHLPSIAIVVGMATMVVAVSLLIFRERDLAEIWDITGVFGGDHQQSKHLARTTEALATSKGLSEREASILHLMAAGASNNDIASELFIAPGTVRAHVSRIYAKLGIHSRQELPALLEGGVGAEP